MSSSIHEKDPANGNGTAGVPVGAAKWYGNGSNGTDLQRPRRLSFNGSDMELSGLKGDPSERGARSEEQKNAVDTKQTLILLAIATTLAVSIKYLLPSFDLVAFGLLLSSFTWYIIYLDSSIPGVNPPTPFSASKKRYRGGPTSKERRFHLPYIMALLSGVVGFLIVLLVNE
uniref:Uncharacterized protein n=1 Tax=Anopheles culicifacies TaxID=139723 RepID=A0A182MI23_9DIPT